MSRLRARCPDCRSLTAVALGAEYQCHSCGREFAAATVRIEGTPELQLPYPEAAVVAPDDPDLAGLLPQLPIVLGGDDDLHHRVEEALRGRGEYLLVTDARALATRAATRRPAGVGVGAGVARPEHAAAIERFLASLGLQP